LVSHSIAAKNIRLGNEFRARFKNVAKRQFAHIEQSGFHLGVALRGAVGVNMKNLQARFVKLPGNQQCPMAAR